MTGKVVGIVRRMCDLVVEIECWITEKHVVLVFKMLESVICVEMEE